LVSPMASSQLPRPGAKGSQLPRRKSGFLKWLRQDPRRHRSATALTIDIGEPEADARLQPPVGINRLRMSSNASQGSQGSRRPRTRSVAFDETGHAKAPLASVGCGLFIALATVILPLVLLAFLSGRPVPPEVAANATSVPWTEVLKEMASEYERERANRTVEFNTAGP